MSVSYRFKNKLKKVFLSELAWNFTNKGLSFIVSFSTIESQFYFADHGDSADVVDYFFCEDQRNQREK